MSRKTSERTPEQRGNTETEGRRKREANILPHRWEPGCPSPNPAGRPRGRTLSSAYRDALDLPPAELRTKLRRGTAPTSADLIAYAVTRKASSGNVRAASEISDRTEGRPKIAGGASVSLVEMLTLLPPLDASPEEAEIGFQKAVETVAGRLLGGAVPPLAGAAGEEEPVPLEAGEPLEGAGGPLEEGDGGPDKGSGRS